MEETIEVVSEDKKTIVGKINGKVVTLHKIDMDEIKNNHNEKIDKAAIAISFDKLEEALTFTIDILKDCPSINEYEEYANNAVELMKSMYHDCQPTDATSLFHQLIKNTEISIYGKAQTFIKQVTIFNETIVEILNIKKELYNP